MQLLIVAATRQVISESKQLETGGDGDSPVSETGDNQAELLLRWNAAEEAIKRAEILGHMISIPAISELRYAGRRVVDALSERDQARKKQLYLDAYRCCERAQSDALDAQAVFLLSAYKDLPARRLSEPGLVELRRLHQLLSELMRAQMERRAGSQKVDSAIEKIVPILNEATELHLKLFPEMMDARAADRRAAVAFRWTVIVAIAAGISALGANLLQLLPQLGL